MRQLVELLNSLAGSAARLPSGLPAAAPSAVAMACASGGPPPPPPLSPAAAAAHPALRAAEAALEAKLADGAAGCDADYRQLHALNDALLQQRGFAAAEAHRELNRYCDVLPFDDNRVRLGQPAFSPPSAADGSAGSAGSSAGGSSAGGSGSAGGEEGAATDYVNASPLRSPASGGGEQWAYIASQGPLRHTREAFWQVAVEHRCSAVVMLTHCTERGVQKCAPYFPDRPRTSKALGRFVVQTAVVEELLPDLQRRSLVVKDGAPPPGRPAKHALQHYHHTAWPDHGVPPSPEPLLALCAELRARGAHAAPILVHCSAGIGRSGVFCVLDILTRRLLGLAGSADAGAGAAAADVAGLVADLRRQRLGMVQTRDQFVFCHTALLHFVRQLAQQAEQEQAPAGGTPAGGA